MRVHATVWLMLALLLAPLGPALPETAQADTVVGAEVIDLLPAGDFAEASEWTLSTSTVYTELPASHTSVEVTGGELSFTHARSVSTETATLWATSTPTSSNESLGAPDTGCTWSTGPNITLDGFDASSLSTRPLLNVSLVVAFRIPDSLQEDTVRFIVHYPSRQDLVKTWSQSFGAIDHLNSPWYTLSLDDDEEWTWSLVKQVQIDIDYVSVGAMDDTRVEVDAAGLMVTYQSMDFGFESARALHTVSMPEPPVLDLNLSLGGHVDVVQTSGGLEVASGLLFGSWTSAEQARPLLQQWDRVHVSGAPNATLLVRAATGATFGDWTNIADGDVLPSGERLQVRVVIPDDDVLEGVRLSFNEPELVVEGTVSGGLGEFNGPLSDLVVAFGGVEVARRELGTAGTFQLSGYVGHLLPAIGGDVEVGLAQFFQWTTEGAAAAAVVTVTDMTITGGFHLDIDRDPVCAAIEDVGFVEDGGGMLYALRGTCSDDRTVAANLLISAVSSDEDVLVASAIGDDIRLKPLPDAFGVAFVDVTVLDEAGNAWSQVMSVTVAPLNDPPVVEDAPREVVLDLGDSPSWTLSISDEDDAVSTLTLATDVSWATLDAAGVLTLAPTATGVYVVTISVSDATATTNVTVQVTAISRADLWIEDISVLGAVGPIEEGTRVSVEVSVRNSGRAPATFFSLRCRGDGTLVLVDEVSILDAGGLVVVRFEWQVEGDGPTDLTCEVDHGVNGDIPELSETNNGHTITVDVTAASGGGSGQGTRGLAGALASTPDSAWLVVAALSIVLVVLVYMFGPGRIRRVR